MNEVTLDLTPWEPPLTQLPADWIAFADILTQQLKGRQHIHVLNVSINARRVRGQLQRWGLPGTVVLAGYLLECGEEDIRCSNLEGAETVLSHIREANIYARYIEEENLPPLLSPPYKDLGALLIAVALFFQALLTLQEQSNEQPYAGKIQSAIDSVGRTLLNIAKRLGMWEFKREVEDLTMHLRSPHKFAESKQELTYILKQEQKILEDVCRFLSDSYKDATQQRINVILKACGVAGMGRRLQDFYKTHSSKKITFTGFDLVTFNVIVPTVEECYTAFGVLNQLGSIQDRVIEQIANPKPNGNSHLMLKLLINSKSLNPHTIDSSENQTYACLLQIGTHTMNAITWFGCLYEDCFPLYSLPQQKNEIEYPSVTQLWHSREGKATLTIRQDLAIGHVLPNIKKPIVVYDKNRKAVLLPKGATALDFAYAVDSETGEHAVDAIVNNRRSPLYRMLDTGDIVEIRTSSEIQTQDYWLNQNYSRTRIARRKIQESLSRRLLNRSGYNRLHQILERYHYMLTPEALDEELRILVKQNKLGAPLEYLERLDKGGKAPFTPEWAAQEIMQQLTERNELSLIERGWSSWVPTLDMHLTANKKNTFRQRLCGFCHPTYPLDLKIMGRTRKRNNELVVHKDSCPYLIERSTDQLPILLPMSWKIQPPAFRVSFFMFAQDRRGLIFDLSRQLRKYQCELVSIQAEVIKFGQARIRFTIETHTDREVFDIWGALLHIDDVTKVELDTAATAVNICDRLRQLRKQGISPVETIDLEHVWEESMIIQQPRNIVLINPFDISRPVSGKMFFGRSSETETMRMELCDSERGKALVLHGPLRSGKSSICTNFIEYQLRDPFWGVLFSLQNVMEHDEEAILMQIAERVCAKFNEQFQRSAPNWQEYHESDPETRFRRILQDCLTQVPETRLILTLDEFGGAIESHEKDILSFRFFNYWKELIREIPQLSLVIILPTSAHRQLTSARFSNVFSFSQAVPVSFLDNRSAQQLLVEPLREEHIEIHPTTVALAQKYTGRNPYYMTLLGQQLFQLLNREPHLQLITDTHLRLIAEQMIVTGSNHNFEFLIKEIQNKTELRVLEAIVEISNQTRQTKVQLRKIAAFVKLPMPAVRRYLDRLKNGLIIDENGPNSNPYYSFKIELARRWLTNNHWFFGLSVHR
jgi:GTP pyrophosphokinase